LTVQYNNQLETVRFAIKRADQTSPVMPDGMAIPEVWANGARVKTINGTEPLDWFAALVDSNWLPGSDFKSVGVRINQLMAHGEVRADICQVDLLNVPPESFSVVFEGGSTEEWMFVAWTNPTFLPTGQFSAWAAARTSEMQATGEIWKLLDDATYAYENTHFEGSCSPHGSGTAPNPNPKGESAVSFAARSKSRRTLKETEQTHCLSKPVTVFCPDPDGAEFWTWCIFEVNGTKALYLQMRSFGCCSSCKLPDDEKLADFWKGAVEESS